MLIKLKVHPGSKEAAVEKKAEDAYEIWVRAPAENGRANREALDALAAALGCPVKKIALIKGGTSPSKIVRVHE